MVSAVRAKLATVIHVPWETLDLRVAEALRALLRGSFRRGTAVVLDLSDVTFVDSFALGVLVDTHRRLRAEGGGLIVANVDDRVLRVLRLSGLIRQPAGTDSSERPAPRLPPRVT